MKRSPMLERLYHQRRKNDFLNVLSGVIDICWFVLIASTAIIISAGFGGTQ